MFSASIYQDNEFRYPRHDLYVFMTVSDGKIKYFLREDAGCIVLVDSSEDALVFDGHEVANRIYTRLNLEDQRFYITPLAAIQILSGICGGITPNNIVIDGI